MILTFQIFSTVLISLKDKFSTFQVLIFVVIFDIDINKI